MSGKIKSVFLWLLILAASAMLVIKILQLSQTFDTTKFDSNSKEVKYIEEDEIIICSQGGQEEMAQLQNMISEIDTKTAILQEAELRLQKLIKNYNTQKRENIAQLSSLYSLMPSQDAAKIIETLDSQDITLLLQLLDKQKATEILQEMNVQKAKETTTTILNSAFEK